LLGVSLAFGLTVTAMAYTLGPISGCHLNPAVTIGFAVAGRFKWTDVWKYVVAQCLGGIVGALAVYQIAKGGSGNMLVAFLRDGFASNGYGMYSPGRFTVNAVMLAEMLATLMFVFVILGVTTNKAMAGFAPICIGLTLAIAHLAIIHVSNASLNPARSLATAVVAKGWAMDQLWAFWVAPILGGIVAGWLHKAGD
jgi:aquaporin Z